MKILFALPGLHRYDRGAEVAFISVARGLAAAGHVVTLIGSGRERPTEPYRFKRAASVARENLESFPSLPVFRNEYAYEEFTFVPGLLRQYRPAKYDVTLTCSYPFTNWALRRPTLGGSRPPHIFVTQNGDWPAQAKNAEFRFFGCEGLVCTNPDYYDRNRGRWRCKLIPNGVDCDRFRPGPPARQTFGLPNDGLVVLMVSALIPTKRVEMGIKAVSQIPHAHLVVAGDGPLRQTILAYATQMMPDRFTRLAVPAEQMPSLYRSADVFLHLSKEEPFGNVFVEALASGLPIVGQASSRLRWIVGEDEFLCDTDDPSAIARNIELAAGSARGRQSVRAEKAARFSWAKIAQMYQEFLDEIVDT